MSSSSPSSFRWVEKKGEKLKREKGKTKLKKVLLLKPLGGEQVVAAPLHHQHSTTTFISVLFGSGYSSSDQLWGQICVCLSDCLSVCVCLCVYFLMLMLKFTKCTTWRCHFTSCHLAVALPVSAFPPPHSPPLLLPLSLSLRLVSSLRLFFIFILAFVFIDSQVVWLFHFSFGRKTFDLPPSPSPPRTHTPASAHPHPHTPSTHS